MLRLLLLSTLLCVPIHFARGDEAPKSAAPTFLYVDDVDAEKQEAIATYSVLVPVTEAITVEVVDPATGAVVKEVRSVTRQVIQQRSRLLAMAELQVTTPAGKEIPGEEALKKMAGSVVLHATQAVDPAYLKLFKDDVLILIQRD